MAKTLFLEWPRWLDRDLAAAYVGVSAFGFNRLVGEGRLPAPSRRLGERLPRWDRLALDATMSGQIGGVDSTDATAAFEAWAKKLETEPKRRVARIGDLSMTTGGRKPERSR
jgi:hypothetical protein